MSRKKKRRARPPGASPGIAHVASDRGLDVADARDGGAGGLPGRIMLLVSLGLVAVGLAAYANSFRDVFLLDDFRRIVENPQIRRLWPPWLVMAGTSRPVVELTLALNYALGGLDVRGYHAVNLAVHLLAGLTLYGVVRRMLLSPRLGPRYGQAAPWLAMAVALLWLVHPLQTESVTYIIQRAESLMGLFLLLTLYCVLRGAESSYPRVWYSGAVVACALGMGTKEVMAVAPILVLLYDRVFLSGSLKEIFRRRWGLYTGLGATWLILGAALATSRPEDTQGVVPGTRWGYALTQFGVILHYLRLSIWPHPLVLDYSWPLADSILAALPAAAIVLALLAATAWALSRGAWVGFWGAWFFLILAPTSSIVPLADVVFEHRMYLPLVAVVVLVTIGAHRVIGRLLDRARVPLTFRRGLETGLLVVAVAILGGVTVRRNEDYRSALAMWMDSVAKRPDNPRAHNNLGIELMRQGRADEALAHFSEAVRLKPDVARAQNNLGGALLQRGQVTEAVAHFSEALRLYPDFVDAHLNLSMALVRAGRTGEAVAHLREAHHLRPGSPGIMNDLGQALAQQGRIQESIEWYAAALRVKPDDADAQKNLGIALLGQGDREGAIAHFSEALRLEPNDANTHNTLGVLLHQQGRVPEAVAHFEEAVRLRPDFAEAQSNLGGALLGRGQIEDAIAHFSEAVRLKPDYAEAQRSLGRALLSRGRVKEATAHLDAAQRLDPNLSETLSDVRAAQAGRKAGGSPSSGGQH
jgi:tetratricopeptide (TPR) repeat protein